MSVGAIGRSGSVNSQDFQRELDAYDREIQQLQKKIRETRGNKKLDEAQKTEQIQLYQQQIQDLTTQKSQKQTELLREQTTQSQQKMEAAQEAKAQKQAEERPAAVVDAGLQSSFIQAQTAQDAAQSLGPVRVQVENELRIASSNSYLRDTPDPAEVSGLEAQLAKIETDRISSLSGAAHAIQSRPQQVQQAEEAEDQEDEQDGQTTSGTGRMEPGQFLDDEA